MIAPTNYEEEIQDIDRVLSGFSAFHHDLSDRVVPE